MTMEVVEGVIVGRVPVAYFMALEGISLTHQVTSALGTTLGSHVSLDFPIRIRDSPYLALILAPAATQLFSRSLGASRDIDNWCSLVKENEILQRATRLDADNNRKFRSY